MALNQHLQGAGPGIQALRSLREAKVESGSLWPGSPTGKGQNMWVGDQVRESMPGCMGVRGGGESRCIGGRGLPLAENLGVVL